MVYPFVSQLNDASSSFFASDTHDGDGGLNYATNNYLGTAIDSATDNYSLPTIVETLQKGVSQVLDQYNNNATE